MTVTLTCSFCGRQETHSNELFFAGWLTISSKVEVVKVCSLECMVSWAMRTQDEQVRKALMQSSGYRGQP